MMDFTGTIAFDLYLAVEVDRKALREQRRWIEILNDLDRADRLATAAVGSTTGGPGGLAGVQGA